MNTCPLCKSPATYAGITSLECTGSTCVNNPTRDVLPEGWRSLGNDYYQHETFSVTFAAVSKLKIHHISGAVIDRWQWACLSPQGLLIGDAPTRDAAMAAALETRDA